MPPCHHCDNRMEPELHIEELQPPRLEELSSNGHVRGTQQIMKTTFTENELTLTKYLKKTYKDVISDHLNPSPMAGKPMHIYLKEGLIVPDRVTTARVIPKRMEVPANKAVQDLLEKKIITPVSTPTDWCSPAFFVGKKDSNKVRMVTDFTKLNKYVKSCLLYTSPSPRD